MLGGKSFIPLQLVFNMSFNRNKLAASVSVSSMLLIPFAVYGHEMKFAIDHEVDLSQHLLRDWDQDEIPSKSGFYIWEGDVVLDYQEVEETKYSFTGIWRCCTPEELAVINDGGNPFKE